MKTIKITSIISMPTLEDIDKNIKNPHQLYLFRKSDNKEIQKYIDHKLRHKIEIQLENTSSQIKTFRKNTRESIREYVRQGIDEKTFDDDVLRLFRTKKIEDHPNILFSFLELVVKFIEEASDPVKEKAKVLYKKMMFHGRSYPGDDCEVIVLPSDDSVLTNVASESPSLPASIETKTNDTTKKAKKKNKKNKKPAEMKTTSSTSISTNNPETVDFRTFLENPWRPWEECVSKFITIRDDQTIPDLDANFLEGEVLQQLLDEKDERIRKLYIETVSWFQENGNSLAKQIVRDFLSHKFVKDMIKKTNDPDPVYEGPQTAESVALENIGTDLCATDAFDANVIKSRLLANELRHLTQVEFIGELQKNATAQTFPKAIKYYAQLFFDDCYKRDNAQNIIYIEWGYEIMEWFVNQGYLQTVEKEIRYHMRDDDHPLKTKIDNEIAAIDTLQKLYDIAYKDNQSETIDIQTLKNSIQSSAFWQIIYNGFLNDKAKLLLETIKKLNAFELIFTKIENKDLKIEKIFEIYKMTGIDIVYLEKSVLPMLEEKNNNSQFENARKLLILCKKSKNEDIQSFADENLEKYPAVALVPAIIKSSEVIVEEIKETPEITDEDIYANFKQFKLKRNKGRNPNSKNKKSSRQTKIAQEEQELVQEEQVLVQEEQELAQEEQVLVQEEQELAQEEQVLVQEEQELVQEEQVLIQEEQELVQQEQETLADSKEEAKRENALPYIAIPLNTLQENDPLRKMIEQLEGLTKHEVLLGGSTPIYKHRNETKPHLPPLVCNDWDFRIPTEKVVSLMQNELYEKLKALPEVLKIKNITKTLHPLIRFKIKYGNHIQKIEIALWEKRNTETNDETMIRTMHDESDNNVSSTYLKMMKDGTVELRGTHKNIQTYLDGFINVNGDRKTIFLFDIRCLFRTMMKADVFELKYHQELKDVLAIYTPSTCFNERLKEPKHQYNLCKFLLKNVFIPRRYNAITAIEFLNKHDLFESFTGLTYENVKSTLHLLKRYNYDKSHAYTKELAFFIFLLAHKCVQLAKNEYIPSIDEAIKRVQTTWKLYDTATKMKNKDDITYLEFVIKEILVKQIRDVNCPTFSNIITFLRPTHYKAKKERSRKAAQTSIQPSVRYLIPEQPAPAVQVFGNVTINNYGGFFTPNHNPCLDIRDIRDVRDIRVPDIRDIRVPDIRDFPDIRDLRDVRENKIPPRNVSRVRNVTVFHPALETETSQAVQTSPVHNKAKGKLRYRKFMAFQNKANVNTTPTPTPTPVRKPPNPSFGK